MVDFRFSLMESCWSTNPVERPTFELIKQILTTVINSEPDYSDYVSVLSQSIKSKCLTVDYNC